MNRRKQRANGRAGLWLWTPSGQVTTDTDNPLLRPCPKRAGGCGAQPRERCTSPSRRRGGRREISGYHAARKTITQETPDASPS